MQHEFTARATRAVDRYQGFLTTLRVQADMAFRRGATSEELRNEALSVALDAARSFVSFEHANLNDDSFQIAIAAHDAAQRDLAVSGTPIADRFGEFVYSAAGYVARIVAAQTERDVMAMASHMRAAAQRVDLYARSGRHTLSSAAAAVLLEDAQAPAFKFIDRAGRQFKSTKHMRDLYRQHLLHLYNEVYMDVIAEHGIDTVQVSHLDPQAKWHGASIAIVSTESSTPLYYDIRDEVFHPSSDAILTLDI